jgi:membrane fusion protein, multidrug efflux system
MKNKIVSIGLIATAMMFSCNNQEVEKNSLDELKVKRDSLRIVFDGVNSQLKDIEKQIEALDSTQKFYTVNYTTANRRNFEHYVEVQGNVNSDQSINMFPETGGLIKNILVKDGQKVTKGQALIQFDNQYLISSREELKTNLELAETTFNKQRKLWEKNIGSEMDYLRAKSNVESLKSKLAALNTQINQTTLNAQFEGIIDQVFVKEGEMANPMMPAVRLINMQKMYVETNVSERYLGLIKKGTKVNVHFPSISKELETTVSIIGNYINPANRSFRVVVDIPNENNEIKPNQLAVLNLNDFKSEGIVIPNRVIMNSPTGESYVYVLSGSSNIEIVNKVFVETGMSYNGETLITKGLKVGDLIVDLGSRSVQDKQKVRVKA